MTPVYYVREIEKIMIAIMDVFNNLRVKRYDDQNRTIEDRTVAIPLYTHNSDDFANYVSSTATAQEPMAVPCAGFRYVQDQHDESHMVQPTYAREIYSKELQKFIRDIQPTPMKVTFELTVLCDNLADFFLNEEEIVDVTSRKEKSRKLKSGEKKNEDVSCKSRRDRTQNSRVRCRRCSCWPSCCENCECASRQRLSDIHPAC